MRRLLKFLHTIGAIGMMGALASLLILLGLAPPPADIARYALIAQGMSAIATFVFYPALVITLIAGLLSIAVTPAFHNAGWVGAKLATGVLIFEGGLVYVQGPLKVEATRSAEVIAGTGDISSLGGFTSAERNTFIVLLIVSAANVALGVWRPRFSKPARPQS